MDITHELVSGHTIKSVSGERNHLAFLFIVSEKKETNQSACDFSN